MASSGVCSLQLLCIDTILGAGREATVPKARRKRRFTLINVTAWPFQPVNKEHAQSAVTSLCTADVMTPLSLYVEKLQ